MRALLAVACAALVLVSASVEVEAQPTLGAPAISSVTAGTNDLTVVWTAPAEDGGATITSYDVRYIESDAADKADANWSVLEGIWSSGTLSYKVASLYDGTGYDIEVRADNGANGPWSATSTGTTTDHGGTTTAATTVTLGSSTPGRIKPASDSDVFRFTLTGEADVWLYATGELDSEGVLTRGRRVTGNNDGLLPPNPLGFSIRALLDAGTYTVAVGSSNQLSTGTYTLHVQIVTQPGGTLGTATAISLGSFHHGLSGDISDDYYTFTLTETTDVWAAVVGFGADLDLLAADGTSLATTRGRIWYHFPSDEGPPDQGQILLRELPAGSYYIKVEQLVTKPTTLFFYTATDPGNSTAGAVQLSPFIPAAGHVSANGDQDYFSITVDQKTYLYLDIVSVGERLPFEIAVLQDGSPVSFFTIPAASFRRTNTAVIARVWGEFSPGTYHVEITAPEGTIGRYMVYPYIDRAYRDLVRTCTALTTDKSDPFFGCQWHLNNRAHIPGGAGHDINIEEAWAITKGEGAKVAIVDDGLHYSHEDLTDNVITANNHDFSGENDPSKVFGLLEFHGTNVAGILAARDNMLGGQGVAPRASIYGYNVTSHLTDDSIARALNLHLDETTVANNSWGIQHTMGDGPVPAPAVWIAALRTGVERGPNGRGISYVWAAGNAHSTVDANYDELTNYFAVTTVCGVNYKDTRALISEVGANLWVCAPTQGIIPLTTGIPQPGILTTDNGDRYIANFSGTSASAPIVSGVIALVRAANPNLTWRDAKLILANSARKNHAGNTGWLAGALKYGSTTDRYSFNHEYGFGVVDAGAAVTLAGTWTKLPALREYEVASDGTDLDIPDLESGSSPTAVESTVTLDSYVEFIEYVELNMDWDHASIRDLKIELESPSGAVSTIAPAHASATGIPWRTRFRFGSSRHLGEDAAGTWTLRVTDVLEEHGGSVRSWSLKVYGHGSVPGFPDITSTTPASNSITVAWSAPGIVGASDITAYDVRYIRSDAADKSDGEWTLTEDVWTATGGGDLEYTMSGLTGNVQYDVRVRAVNAEGDGPWSAVGTATPPIDRAPTIDSVTPGDRSIIVGWTAPTSATLGTITSYDLRYIRSDASNKADDNRTVVSAIWTSGPLAYTLNPTAMPLVNGVSYDVQVRAVVGPDQHPWSGVRSAKPHTTPGIPTIDTVTGGDGAFAVEWNRPLSDGGDEITSYDLRHIKTSEDETVEANWTVEVGVWSSGDSGLEYDVAGLETGTQYDVQVRAVNAAGEGAWSATSVGTTRPGAPAIDSVTGLARGLTVGWSAAATDGDATVTTYDLRYIKTSDDEAVEANWTVEVGVWSSGDLTATVTGLDVGTQYDVQMRAFNASGEGPWSPTRMGTTALSDDATLSALTLSGARLTPAFKSGTTSYTASVGYTVARITVASTTSNVNATVEFLDGDDNTLSTADTVQVDLSVGENTIKVEVTAQDGVATETYTITVTRTEEDLSLTPPASDPVAPFASTATYTIRFRGWWTRAVTPDGLPSGAHFSRLIGAVHNAGVKDGEGFLESGETASGGIKSMAEFGGTSTLKGEVNLARNANPPTALSVLEGSTSFINPTATRTLSNRTLTTEFPLVTLTTMIAPSHDWFVGVSGLPLLDASGHWLRSHEVDLFPWDAGTEEGDDFSLNPSVTTQGGVITSIRGTGRFTTERIASLTFTLQSVRTARSLDENTPGGVDIGAPVVAVANSGTVGYTLGGTDAASFDLDGASGQLRTKPGVTYDHDTKSSYTVTVTATDTDGSIVTTVNIAVENINEPPAINGPAAVDFAEGGTGSVATFSLTDQDGDTVSWEALTGTDHDDFSFNNGVLTFVTTPNFEAPTDAAPPSNEYSVRLRASDGSNTTMHDVTVTVTNEEEPGMLGLSSEQPLIGTVLTATLTDPDGVLSESWSWERSPNQSSWSAITGQTTSSYTPVAADEDRYLRVTVEYTDGQGSGKTAEMTSANAVAANPPPVFDPTSVTFVVNENANTGTAVGTVTATDLDNDRIIYSVGGAGEVAFNQDFSLDSASGAITVGAPIDHERKASYAVTITATDPFGSAGTISVTINVTNVDEAGTVTLPVDDPVMGRPVTATLSDPDGEVTSQIWTWAWSTSSTGGFSTISGASSATYTPVLGDVGRWLKARVSYSDFLGSGKTAEMTSTNAVAANPPPVFSDAFPTFMVDENATSGAVGTVTATDPDGEAVTYSVSVGGADVTAFNEDFSLGSSSGAITVKTGATIDHESKASYAVTITATDTAGITATAAVTINVTNLDEAGAVDLPPGRPVVGKSLTATLSDPDGGVTIPTWTWAWSTSSSGSFTPISSASSATYTPVPEDEGRYLKASVSYTDGQGSGKTAEMTSANAVSANPPPVFDPTSVTFAVDENATTGTAVGTVTATDIDNNRIIYSVGGAGAVAFNQDFSLDSASGAITVGAPIDHENKASYAVTITATDPFESAGTISVTINVTNVDEAGTVTLPVDDPVMGRPVTATLSDPDGEVTSQIWTWAWSTSSTGGFSTISGASSATYTPVLGDVGRWLKARVSYSDFQGSGKTAEMTSADAVAANPPPAFANSSPTFAVNENATTGTTVGTVTATDPDGEAVTYSVSVGGADVTAFNEDFSLGSSSGAITVKTGATIDHERRASYAVTITATDIVGITATAAVAINVTDVDEAGAVALTADTPAVGKPLTAILSDPDGGVTSPTWTWASSTTRTGSFTTISSASSATYTPLVGELARFLKASVSYTDSFGAGKTAEMASVNAVSANPPPVFANSSPTFTVNENASSGAVGTVTAADPESEAVTYSVGGADVTAFNEDFSLGSSSGAITVKSGATIDHESKSSYAVTITATDTAGITATAAVTINVTDVDEAGAVALTLDPPVVGKQLTATLSEPDGGVTSPTWSWASSTTRTGNFRTLNGANSASYTVGPGDVARFLKASVSYTDSFGSGKTAEMTSANAAAASPPPVFGDASVTFTVDENATTGTVGTVTATDPDSDAITYSVDGGAGAPAFNEDFSLGSASGTIRVKPDATIDHESRPSYSVTITATDRFGSTDTISVTINVTDVDEAGTVALTADTPAVGSSLTATLSDLDGGVTGETWTWAWSTDRIGTFTPIPGASSATYTPVQGDFARFLKASVSYTDSFGSGKSAEMASANAVAANPSPIISGGGGGGGGGGGPSPSVIDFEWTVTRDIDDLGSGHDKPSGQWSDGTTIWVLENGDGADDAIYAYDLASGERVPDREFELDGANRAPRGVWSDGATMWVSDSGRNRLFAHDLESGERLPERDIAFAGRNRDARGIWSGDETMWVLDGGKDSLFAYDLASGELLAEYELASANGDPRGIWSDGVTVWVSDHGAKRLIAYRLPARPEAPATEDAERQDLERVSDEEFKDLSKASNNSPRGIWSDGDVMYVADESDGKVYSYNMPNAIDARLASLSLSGVDIGEFSSSQTEYTGSAADGTTATTVAAEALQRRTIVAIDPPDADEAAEGHQVALEDLGEITVTLTSEDGSRERVYRVRLGEEEAAGPAPEEAAGPAPDCLRGAVSVGFSLVVYEGGSVGDLVACAEGRNVTAFYALGGGEYLSYILGAPEFVNQSFAALFADGVPTLTPLTVKSGGPATAAPVASAVTGPWAACLQGEIAEGFNLVVYEGGSVGDLEACAEGVGLAALYALNDGVWVSYILGAPEFVNAAFRELFTDGVPVATPLVGKRD